MPLNLLQHKSWHVGSAKNQERVRRDEREARLKEEEEERRMQLADVEHRLKILRTRMQTGQTGNDVSLQVDHDDSLRVTTAVGSSEATEWGKRERTSKKRRRDDDDDEIPPTRGSQIATMKYSSSDAPLTGPDGHINLFPPEAVPQKGTESFRNKECMAEKKQKEEELEAQYTMKLSRPSEPWYSTSDMVAEADRDKAENLRKKEERVEQRVREENDPMNLMKKGLAKLREVRSEAALERRKRDADVGIGLGEDVERDSGRDRDPGRDCDGGQGADQEKGEGIGRETIAAEGIRKMSGTTDTENQSVLEAGLEIDGNTIDLRGKPRNLIAQVKDEGTEGKKEILWQN
ncbi:hypothetical protein ABW19_dt0207727 [Dactylella cylindrospora]|nr:hypothetical protein ABW19_dt0207727 [Dactylella cylindrospora]